MYFLRYDRFVVSWLLSYRSKPLNQTDLKRKQIEPITYRLATDMPEKSSQSLL